MRREKRGYRKLETASQFDSVKAWRKGGGSAVTPVSIFLSISNLRRT